MANIVREILDYIYINIYKDIYIYLSYFGSASGQIKQVSVWYDASTSYSYATHIMRLQSIVSQKIHLYLYL